MIATLFLAGVTILLPAESGARGTQIELGEIATITGADANTLVALENLVITNAPTPGYRRVVDRNDILKSIRYSMPSVEVTFSGRSAVSVFPETVIVDAASIVAEVDAKLIGARGTRDITWQPNSLIGSLEVPRDDQGTGLPSLEVVLGSPELQSGLIKVLVNVRIGGVIYRRVHAEWRVSVWEELPVLTINVPAGERVTTALFRLARVERPSDPNQVILKPASMVGAIAKRNLTAGSVIIEDDVTRPKVIKVGDQVDLIVIKGSIRVKVRAIAQETAGIGDHIRVRRVDMDVELKAQVNSSDLVVLNLDA